MHTRSFTIQPVAPFDFHKSLEFLHGFGPMEGDQALDARRVLRGMRADGQLLAIEVTSEGTTEEPLLLGSVHSASSISDTALAAARMRITHYLSTQDDLGPLLARAEQDPAFSTRVQRWYGLHQPCFFSPFEIAAWAVLTQRTPVPVARQLKMALVHALGDVVTWDGHALPVFPEAHVIAGLSVENLARHVGGGRRPEYLHAVATEFAHVDEHWLRTGPVDDVVAWLKDIRGLGEWSSAFVALRGLGRTEFLPVHLARVLEPAQALYGRVMTMEEAQRIADGYGALKGYWALYIRAGGFVGRRPSEARPRRQPHVSGRQPRV